RRMGRKTTGGGGTEGCAARSRTRGESSRVYRAHASVQAEVPRSFAGDCAHAAGAKAVLRVHGIQLRVVRERSGKSVQHTAGQAVYLATAAHTGRTIAGVGPAELSHERYRFQSGKPRRIWRGL